MKGGVRVVNSHNLYNHQYGRNGLRFQQLCFLAFIVLKNNYILRES